MDAQRFDNLTRALGQRASRRQRLRGLAAGLVGAAALRGQMAPGQAQAQAQAARNRPTGASCTRGGECASRVCVDGVCCATSCAGQCEACNLPGQVGSCQPVSGAPVGNRGACPGQGICAATCDGIIRDRCSFPTDDVVCGDTTCVNGWQTNYACAGNGTCAPTTTACGDDRICQDGACVACPIGASACGGACITCAGGRQPNPATCACECPPGTEPVRVDDSGQSVCLSVCPAETRRCGELCLPFCALNTPHAGGCAECVCPAGGITCTLPSNYDQDQTCCAADQECCRVGPIDDPATTVVCCIPGTCVPGAGCQ